MKGMVNWFSKEKGFGFITPEDNSKDIFVHYTGILRDGFKDLEEGQTVDFELSENKKGPIAINVKVTGKVAVVKNNNSKPKRFSESKV